MGSLESNSLSLDYNMAEANSFNAVFEPARSSDTKIVINEINYISSPYKDTKDWVELYNAGNSTVNLKNWIISDGGPETGYVFPADFIFSPGMYLVVCRDITSFRLFWPGVTNIVGDMEFGLSSSGDNINLYDADGNLVDFVSYTTSVPWPTDAIITGASIELTNPFSDNNSGNNWKTGHIGGTPGIINYKAILPDTTGELPGKGCRLTCFPNPFQDYTTMRVEVSASGRYRIEIYDIQGKLVNTLTDQSIEAGEYYIDWYGKGFNNASLPGGVYIIRLTGENQYYNTRVIILK
jgi:hypothetical protein